ncbi:hypothetical protein [Litorimonas haliclonae]|uniref:hypothetical protein n=1 Tax=Litorimonas haliclonae TaxID=2081977 RepID=UPI0039EE23CC
MRFRKLSTSVFCAVASATLLSTCGDTTSQPEIEGADAPNAEATQEKTLAADGRIVISSLPKVSEPNACILPITITNGTETETIVSMMGFKITGSGQDDSGNMFAQTVSPGETNTARLLFPTRQCEELSVITAPDLTCQSGGKDCSDAIEFEAQDGLIFQRE